MDNDGETRGNQRKRSRREDDLADKYEEGFNLKLTLGSTSHEIPSMTLSLGLAPPSPTHLMMMMPFSTFSYPSSQTRSRGGESSSSTPIQLMRVNIIPPKPVKRQRTSGNQKSDTIPPPFPWATDIRGEIHSQEYLESEEITTITGDVQCRYCEKVSQVSFNLRERFAEVEMIFKTWDMRERAPLLWRNPEAGTCETCGREKAVKPVIAEKKSEINWLFLLLGQTLGFCTLEQLKYFCKHSQYHRSGAKERVLYLTYLGLSKMLKAKHLDEPADSNFV